LGKLVARPARDRGIKPGLPLVGVDQAFSVPIQRTLQSFFDGEAGSVSQFPNCGRGVGLRVPDVTGARGAILSWDTDPFYFLEQFPDLIEGVMVPISGVEHLASDGGLSFHDQSTTSSMSNPRVCSPSP
jgi:hypothetical protein